MLFLILNLSLYAQTLFAPPDFNHHGKKAVFVDFIKANYTITINKFPHASTVETEIEILQTEEGHIIFDLKKCPKNITLDNQAADSKTIFTPEFITKVRILKNKTAAGTHTLKLKNNLNLGVSGKADIYFQMRDLYNRHFLEQYIPTNLEYDQYQINMKVVLNVPNPENYLLITNTLNKNVSLDKKTWYMTYPEYFNASAMFFHLIPKNKYNLMESNFTMSSGKILPITLYGDPSQNLNDYKEKTLKVLAELQNDYGDFSHPLLIVYAQGNSGGMEFAGATETSLVSLGHELFHSYFGRGVMPANGSTGGLDEGLASWRDHDYFNVDRPNYDHSNICRHSVYSRKTDKKSYKLGRQFFAYIDQQIKDIGGLRPFLKKFYQEHTHSPISIEMFQEELNQFTGRNFDSEFQQYLYSK